MHGRAAQLWLLFTSLLRIGAFTFGGGYAMIPLIKYEVVDRRRWIRQEDFMDSLAIIQSAPGPIAVNAAVFVGFRVWGTIGAVVAAVGAALPSYVIMVVVAAVFSFGVDHPVVEAVLRGVRPAVVALILSAAVRLGERALSDLLAVIWFVVSVVVIVVFGVHPIVVLVSAGVWGLFTRYHR